MQSNSKDREELERIAWAWVDEITDPDNDQITEDDLSKSYRLHFPLHKSPEWKCKKNCRSNPRCYCSLGEAQWLDSTTDGTSTEEDEEDMSLEMRLEGMPVGLKNLGNTCYVNSFLQIWFHNLPFREALYKWDPDQDDAESQNETILDAENYRPKGKVASLQALFAMMEFTNRRAVDPNDFIAKLGLDPQVQQDAAEFSKLFISLLESNLSNQECDEVRSIVQNQFRGEYAYVTTCYKCQRESKRSSAFYELDLALQGQKTLANCLEDFLKEEKLEGDNQYYCGGCQSKQDATRCVRLSNLPPVLNLQLNRFIFDMQTGRKKKLNSFVQFPEVLDMSSYLRQPSSDSNTYHLTGVLMHVGAEANHGHYIAHIQEAGLTGQHWFKFSDAYVEKLEGKNPRLGSENDPLTEHTSNGSSNHSSSAKKQVNGTGSSKHVKVLTIYLWMNLYN
jgi:ubiquitin carboxyl-terminal hydrolase 48